MDLSQASWNESDASNNQAAPDGFPEGMAPSGVNNSARMMMGALKRWYNQIIPKTTDGTGTSAAYTLTYTVAPTALADGMGFLVRFDKTCGAAPTLNVNALGAVPLYKYVSGAWAAVGAAEITADMICRLAYNQTAGAFFVTSSSLSTIGAAFLAATNAFTGTNSFAGNTLLAKTAFSGGSNLVPQGRLTLASGAPVMTSAQTGKTLIYYTPYVGNLVPLFDGTNFQLTPITELSNDTTQSGAAGPAAVVANSNYDLLLWNNGGTPTLSRSAPWASDTARGTGSGTAELQRVNGFPVNKQAITNGPPAGYGTYVGTVRSDSSGQINWQPGGIGSGGTAALLGVWNAYNRINVKGLIGDSTNSWSYNGTTTRPADNSTTMRVSFVQGLQEESFEAKYEASFSNDSGGHGGYAGVGYDNASAFSGSANVGNNGTATGLWLNVSGAAIAQDLGFHFMQALEAGTGGGTQTWFGDNGGAQIQNALTYTGKF